MTQHTPKLVSFGLGGHSIEYTGRCHLSGYSRPENLKITPDLEGVPVLDKRPALETDEGYRWVFRGPMVNVELDDSDVDRCPEPSPIFAGAMAESGNSYGTLLAIHAAHTAPAPGPLDAVSIPVYMQGWIDRGARYGVIRRGAIEWNN